MLLVTMWIQDVHLPSPPPRVVAHGTTTIFVGRRLQQRVAALGSVETSAGLLVAQEMPRASVLTFQPPDAREASSCPSKNEKTEARAASDLICQSSMTSLLAATPWVNGLELETIVVLRFLS